MPNSQQRTPKRGRRLTRGQVASALSSSGGMITLAAQSLGCHHTALYRWLERDPSLREVVESEREKHIDIAETALKRAALKGEAWAVCFTLKTIGKKRGYVERQEVTGAEGGPIQHQITDERQIAKEIIDMLMIDKGLSEIEARTRALEIGVDPEHLPAIDATHQ